VEPFYALDAEEESDSTLVSLNTFFLMAMVSRLYLVLRCVATHSTLEKHCFLLTVVPMNGVKFGLSLMAKSYLKRSPHTVLLIVALGALVILSWLLTVSETGHGNLGQNYAQCAWIIIITMLTVGYGDAVPTTYPGRVISVATGLLGMGIMAFTMATLMQSLQLSRSERNVLRTLANAERFKQRRHIAACILWNVWLWHRLVLSCSS
jgi:hypothetical protein